MHFIIPSIMDPGTNKDFFNKIHYNHRRLHHMMTNQGTINSRLCHQELLDQLLNLFKIKKVDSDQFKTILIQILSSK